MPEEEGQMPTEDEDFDVTSQGGSEEPNAEETNTSSQADMADDETNSASPEDSSEVNSSEDDSAENDQPESSEQTAESEENEDHETSQPDEAPEVEESDGSDEMPVTVTTPKTDSAPVAARPVDGFSVKPRMASTPVSSSTTDSSPESTAAKPKLEAKMGPSSMGKKSWFSSHIIVEAVLIVAVVVLSLWGWNLKTDNDNLTNQVASLNANPQAVVQKQTDALIATVGKLIQLPSGETPTVAAVSDASAAKKQSAFFNNAQDGDKVLMYVKAGEAILYRPSTNKIVLVAPLTLNNGTAATSATTTKTPATTTAKP